MIKRYIKKWLGIEEIENRNNLLENKISFIEKKKSDLENRVIKSEKEKENISKSISESVNSSEINYETKQFLKNINVQLTNQNLESVLTVLTAKEVVDKYNFKRFDPNLKKEYNSQVITMEEFKENPELYLHKLGKGFLNFPLNLNFDQINEILNDNFGNISIETNNLKSNNGTFNLLLTNVISKDYLFLTESEYEIGLILSKASKLSHINQINYYDKNKWFIIDTIDFISNYNGIKNYILDFPGIDIEKKKKTITALEFAKFSYLTALEVVGTTRIKDNSELLNFNSNEKEYCFSGEIEKLNPSEQLKQKLKISLLYKQQGTTFESIQKLLPIRSIEKFRQLSSEITDFIFTKDKERNGLTDKINKQIEDYSIGEFIALATYFSRNVITRYKTLDNCIDDIFSKKINNETVGKCTDFTGLTLQYLNEYLIPLYPNKFKNWTFGYDSDNIGDYNHCYLKVIHRNKDLSHDIYFLDPTSLANKGIDELKNPDNLIEDLSTNHLPLLIERDAEDLLYSAKEKMKNKVENIVEYKNKKN